MRLSAAALMLAMDLFAAEPAQAFREIEVGERLPNRDLATLEGKKAPFLTSTRANVFVFLRAGHGHCAETLHELAKIEGELRGKPVRLVGIVSDSDDPEEVRAMIRESGVGMPILVDKGDALYGELGVALYPSIGIADDRQKLVAYQAYRRINLADILRARIRLALGEITEAELQAVIEPPATEIAVNRARARLNMAKALLAAGDVDGAVESARAAVALEPKRADTHAMLAEVLAQAGRCDESAREANEARFIDPRAPRVSACRR